MKKIVQLILVLSVSATLLAQTTSKEINAIKRNPLYMYSEATMENEAEARDVAYELLMQQIQDYIGTKRKLSQADNILIKDMRSKVESLSMMRGTMYRVFVYVKRTDIEGVTNTTVINNGSGTTITVSDAPTTIVDVSTTAAGEPTTHPQQPSAQHIQPVEEPTVPANMTAIDDESHVFTDEFQPEDEATQQRLAQESSAGTTISQKVESPLVGWQQQAIASLLECNDMTAFRAQLNRMKTDYRVKRYGTPDNCTSPTSVFWAIFDANGRLITILGTGDSQRIDYRTMHYSSLEAHKGMNALWFTLAK